MHLWRPNKDKNNKWRDYKNEYNDVKNRIENSKFRRDVGERIGKTRCVLWGKETKIFSAKWILIAMTSGWDSSSQLATYSWGHSNVPYKDRTEWCKKSCEIGHKCIRDDTIFLLLGASIVVDPQTKGDFKSRDMRGLQCYGILFIRVIISYSMCVDYKWYF